MIWTVCQFDLQLLLSRSQWSTVGEEEVFSEQQLSECINYNNWPALDSQRLSVVNKYLSFPAVQVSYCRAFGLKAGCTSELLSGSTGFNCSCVRRSHLGTLLLSCFVLGFIPPLNVSRCVICLLVSFAFFLITVFGESRYCQYSL